MSRELQIKLMIVIQTHAVKKGGFMVLVEHRAGQTSDGFSGVLGM